MTKKQSSGSFINNRFEKATGALFASFNPAQNYEPVFEAAADHTHVEIAIKAAKAALLGWQDLKLSEREEYLLALKASFIKHEELIASAISQEMGKILSEARTEAKSLSARIDLIINYGIKRVATEYLYEQRAETRYHNQGVLAVIGPYNFPAHLINAHVIPALITGNALVVKPSEICPWVGELYAQCFLEAHMPAGVFNMIQGDGALGKALCAHQDIDGVLFTGSYATGRALQELLLDQPHKILALEMGGKNCAVVMDDADLKQAALEIIQGAYLTSGQRCTATSRVLIHEKIFDNFAQALVKIAQNLPANFYGPLASKKAHENFLSALGRAREEGAQVLLESHVVNNIISPAIYQVSSDHPLKGFLGEELFGPHMCVEKFSSLEHAIRRIKESPYGLSNAIFTLDLSNAEKLYRQTKSGVLNINRSTNGANGAMPFGGVNKSGNQRPAGIDAVRYTSFPVALNSLAYASHSASQELESIADHEFQDLIPLNIITLRHELEALFESFGINSTNAALDRLIFSKSSFNNSKAEAANFFSDLESLLGSACKLSEDKIILYLNLMTEDNNLTSKIHEKLEYYKFLRAPNSLNINIPQGLNMPRSQSMLDRLYRGNFVPMEKKSLVADLYKSKGPFLASVDDDALVLFDAASQIATLGSGFLAETYENAYDQGDFDKNLIANYDLAQEFGDNSAYEHDALEAQKRFENFLHEKSQFCFSSISYGSSGAEANEIAFDLCRQNGPGGTRIIAFEGSFHGRTIMALQATYNKEKRGPFVFENYEAIFLPFPVLDNPLVQPSIPEDFIAKLSSGQIPVYSNADELLKNELDILEKLRQEIAQSKICCVIIEPMQCEGGDRYASNRFFNGLRALTKALGVPLVFDEVQTGFNLGRTFFWHEYFDLRDEHNKPSPPDCVSLGKKAQLGVTLSIWPYSRSSSPHIIQLKRGLLQGEALCAQKAMLLEQKAYKLLERLQEYFPKLVSKIRAFGFAFAFDMPNNALAMQLINQRFERGFMAYIAGEKTLRFRLNMTSNDEIINRLFEMLFIALADVRDNKAPENYFSIKKQENKKQNINIILLDKNNFYVHKNSIQIVENNYEEGRRDSLETLENWLAQEHSLGLILKTYVNNEEILGGYAIGGPLSHARADGCAQDPLGALGEVFYSANITLDPRVQGLGLGRILKEEQIKRVSLMRKLDNQPRYKFIAGRNRLDHAEAMTRINESLGSYTVKIYDHQYGDPKAQAAYYRLPLFKSHEVKPKKYEAQDTSINCQNSLQMPLLKPSQSFLTMLRRDQLRVLSCSKLTLSNWATPHLVRYSELLRALMPRALKHAYFTSGRDEVVDKGLRSLRFHRAQADIALGFSHQWLGHVSASARSLSHDECQAQPFKFFSWPHAGHPSVVGCDQSLDELKKYISHYGPERILGIIIELMGEKSGLYFDNSFLYKLDELRAQTKIPLVFVENASSFGRSGRSLFLSDALDIKPNMVWWYSGGQLGHVFVDESYFVKKPLTLISTWDGDELSIARAYHHMLAAHEGAWQEPIRYFEERMKKLKAHGLGCWQGIKLESAEKLASVRSKAQAQGLLLGAGFDNTLMVCAKPDLIREEFDNIINKLALLLV